MFKNSRWANEILSLQKDDGSWGNFHSLSQLNEKYPITTEQALRRLKILGYTIEDVPIMKSVSYIHNCLDGTIEIPDRKEKTHHWDIFTSLIFATWIREFTLEDKLANSIADKWAEVISYSFKTGEYNHEDYINIFERVFKKSPRGGRLIDFVSFYQVSIISNSLERVIEERVFDYILQHQFGIYYIYSTPLNILPKNFKSKDSSRYLGAIELLAEYKNETCKRKLKFVVDWLNENKDTSGYWDMGSTSKDGIYFPLSDSWRKELLRKQDCSYRIQSLINKINVYTTNNKTS